MTCLATSPRKIAFADIFGALPPMAVVKQLNIFRSEKGQRPTMPWWLIELPITNS